MQKAQNKKLELQSSLQYVKGVGPQLAEVFKKASLQTVQDFINKLPKAYQDNRVLSKISDIVPGQNVIFSAHIFKKNIIPLRARNKNIYEIVLNDGFSTLSCKFFKIPYRNWFNSLRVGELVEIKGKALLYRNQLEIHHPQIFPFSRTQNKEEQKISVLYSEIQHISQNKIQKIMKTIFEQLDVKEKDQDWLPEWLRKKYKLISRFQALKGMHFPDINQISLYMDFKTDFQKRLIFDEFFELQFYFALKKQGWSLGHAFQMSINKTAVSKMAALLPFQLTSSQWTVLNSIFSDLSSSSPMHRLIQGDVGCGKTVVALISALVCAKAGYQTALMVPTDLLAHQHYQTALRFLKPFKVRVKKLTGKMKSQEKKQTMEALSSGSCDICIGTHALIQENVQFHKLALVIIDEQHRFGSHQRALLKSKGKKQAHFLVMTATPIPRSLSLTLYGDLDVSLINERPLGRKSISTKRVFPSQRKEIFDFLRRQVLEGRQGYVVYPLIEESEHFDLKNAIDQYQKLKSYYSDINWGLLTGKMGSEEKQTIMDRFKKGQIQVLISTTVIEVGVDVPNATVMIIEHAERFGMAQMHQLRGRIGRGPYKSYCFVVLGKHFSKESSQRANIMQNNSDGFQIAEKDLETRGPGEFLGHRQSGLPSFKIANLIRDIKILSLAKQAARDLLSLDSKLQNPEHEKIKQKFRQMSASIRPG